MVVHERIIRDGVGVADNHTPKEQPFLDSLSAFILRRQQVAEYLLTLSNPKDTLQGIIAAHPSLQRLLLDTYIAMFDNGKDVERNKKIIQMMDWISEIGG